MSAVRSSAVIGASRWLDANRLEGTSTSSVMVKATISFTLFMGITSVELVDVAPPDGYDWLRLLAYVRTQSQIGWVRFADSELSRPDGSRYMPNEFSTVPCPPKISVATFRMQ